MTQPTLKFKPTIPGIGNAAFPDGEPSFADLDVSESSLPSAYALGWHDSWCADGQTFITAGATYTATVYSSYEYAVLRANPTFATLGNAQPGAIMLPTTPSVPTTGGSQPYLENLDIINWLLNNITPTAAPDDYTEIIRGVTYSGVPYYNVTGLGSALFTFTDIQQAIYQLLGDGWETSVLFGSTSQASVQTLVGHAITSGEGFVPNTDGVTAEQIAVILDIRNTLGAVRQYQIMLTPVAKLGDFVWNDLNANGIQDVGEPGIDGATVNLYGVRSDGVSDQTYLIATTTTGDDPYTPGLQQGYYEFKGLTPGLDYQVEFITPAGFDEVSPRQVAGGTPANDSDGLLSDHIVLGPGEFNRTIDSGFYKYASIGDRVWVDCNGNGIQNDGEIGLAGVTVKLLDGAGNVVGTTTTGASGDYLFDMLTPGDYAIEVVRPTGYTFTIADQGTNDALDSDVKPDATVANPQSARTIVTTLTSGENDLTWDAGLFQACGVCLDLDLTTNTNSDCNDGNIRTVTQNGVSAKVSAFSRTNDGGTWEKAYLGSYSGGLGVTNVGESGDSPSHAVDNVYRTDYVLFEFNRAVVLDSAFLGWVQTDSDMQVWIGTSDNPYANHLTLSDAVLSGMFTEANATSSAYARTADVNVGGLAGNVIVIAASTDNADGKADQFKIKTLELCTPKCGLTASIGNRVWYDTDGDGIQDSGEAGVAGVTIALMDGTNTEGASLKTTTTDANGYYLFEDLAPGQYQINIDESTLPSGYVFTKAGAGSDNTKDSDVTAVGSHPKEHGRMAVTTLDAGENDLSWDAGIFKPAPACLGDRVWLDLNGNGKQDSGESGISGLTVKLIGGGADGKISTAADNTSTTTTTDTYGNYKFTGLTAGVEYQVQFSKPSSAVFTKQNAVGVASGKNSDAGADGKTQIVTLAPGENNTTLDAGVYYLASVGNKVWEDWNHNYIQDTNVFESGIGKVKVDLMDATGTTVLKTTYTSDVDAATRGTYKFTDLAPGTYVLRFDKTNVTFTNSHWNSSTYNMNDWFWAVKDAGGDSVDSDVGKTTGKDQTNVTYTSAFTLTSGQNDMTRDAGITPIVIDLDGNGVETTSRANAGGSFDLFGNGSGVQSGWISGSDGFLAVDRNGNGEIDSISELFGGTAKGAGFAQLADYDSNDDGLVNLSDNAFADLKIWRDANGNHQTDDGELLTLADAGVSELVTGYIELPFLDRQGNVHLERSSATMSDGRTVDMTDVYFNVAADDAAAAGVDLAGIAELLNDIAWQNAPVADAGWLFA